MEKDKNGNLSGDLLKENNIMNFKIDIPIYNLINNMFMGIFFMIILRLIYWMSIDKMVEECMSINYQAYVAILIFAYFVGVIIKSVGVFLENYFLIRWGILQKPCDYTAFNKKRKEGDILSIVAREATTLRSLFTLFMIVTIILFIYRENVLSLMTFVIAVVLIIECRKQRSRICELVNSVEEEHVNEK